MNVFHEIDRVGESTGSRLPLGRSGYRVTTKSENVLTTVGFRFLSCQFELGKLLTSSAHLTFSFGTALSLGLAVKLTLSTA